LPTVLAARPTHILANPRRKKTRYLRCFCSEIVKTTRKHHLCDDF
jgi:hypothetical protein